MIATVTLTPAMPVPLLAAFCILSAVLLGFGLWRRARGIVLRAVPVLALIVAIADPVLLQEQRAPLSDIVVVVVDETESQKLAERMNRTAQAANELATELALLPNLDVRTIRVTGMGEDGTRLFTALNEMLADIPTQRFAGTIMISDGQVHDVPPPDVAAQTAWQKAPLHVLLTGQHREQDRRIRIERAPEFGLVDRTAMVRLRIEDAGENPAADVEVTLRRNGGETRAVELPVGQSIEMPVGIIGPGTNVLEIDLAPRDGELSLANNRAVVTVTGIRDRLRVLLISGQPHVGERAWRNLLKSDPNVDLVHFTILRPLTKDDGTPLQELALIAFPTRELFEEQLHDFDLVIFDRYSRRGLVPFQFMSNVAAYVRDGGAVMLAVGPEYADAFSLYDSPLQGILPAAPTGQVSSRPFQPRISSLGTRHPVTAQLTGAITNDADDTGVPHWGRWLRHVDVGTISGEVIMTGDRDKPLLVLDHIGKGRVALLLSDTIWLWGKNFEGGGPQAELLRRVSHWLMKEPELEEEALTAEADNAGLSITRRSLDPAEKPVTVTGPDGNKETVVPHDIGRGQFTARLSTSVPGLYHLSDGTLSTVAAVGSSNPLENYDVVATEAKVSPAVDATDGGIYWLSDGGVPAVRQINEGRAPHGVSWLGLKANNQSTVTGVEEISLAPDALILLALMLGAMLTWWREGQ